MKKLNYTFQNIKQQLLNIMRKICIIVVILFIIALGLLPLLLFHQNEDVKHSDIYYYCVETYVAIGTILATLMALFGKEIRNYFFRGVLDAFGGELKENSKVEKSYLGYISIKNTGNKAVNDCELVIDKVEYMKNSATNKFNDLEISKSQCVYWDYNKSNSTIYKSETKDVQICKIFPESQTPSQNIPSKKEISIMGCKLGKNNKKGKWRISYQIRNSEKVLKMFVVEIYWSGELSDTLDEMKNELTINVIK